LSQRRTAVADEEALGRKRDQQKGRSGVTGEVAGDQDPEAETKNQDATGKSEGLAEKVKEKGEELLDKISGPDVPPSLTDEEKKA
jgi:uncharacterized protein YjbJ (UPF0337 family)